MIADGLVVVVRVGAAMVNVAKAKGFGVKVEA